MTVHSIWSHAKYIEAAKAIECSASDSDNVAALDKNREPGETPEGGFPAGARRNFSSKQGLFARRGIWAASKSPIRHGAGCMAPGTGAGKLTVLSENIISIADEPIASRVIRPACEALGDSENVKHVHAISDVPEASLEKITG